MSIEGTIGIILTVALGAASLYYAIRRKKYPKRMEFYVLDLVRIISPLVRKYESIKLLHNDQETKNVSFLRGMFLCVGDEDVELKSDNNSGGLQVSLPDGYKWLEVHPQERTKGLEVNCTIDVQSPNVLLVTADLFKRDEAFTFDAYVEGNDDTRLESACITIDHRLNNTEEIYARKINIPQMRKRKKRLWLVGIYLVVSIILTCAMSYGLYYDRPIRYVDKQQSENVYSAVLISNDSVAVSDGKNGVLPWNREHLSIDEFKQKYEIYTNFHEMTTWDNVLMIGIPMLMNIIVAILLILLILMYRRQMRVIDVYEKIQFKGIVSTKKMEETQK